MTAPTAPPLVSVITPFLNAAAFLEEAIVSVLRQSEPRWELWLIDDGSDDGSADIAGRYAAAMPDRVRYRAQPGRRSLGASAARNIGLRAAQGRYVAFLDADDVWLPEKLARQTRLLEEHPATGMLYGPTQDWYSWSGRPEDRERDNVPALNVAVGRPLSPPGPLPAFLRRQAPTPCTCSVLVRRDVALAVGGFEESFRGMYDDQAFYAKVCLAAPVLAAPDWLDRYRRHPDSCYARAKASGRAKEDRRVFLEWLAIYLQERGERDEAVWRALRRELRPYRHPVLDGILRRAERVTKRPDRHRRHPPSPPERQ